MAIHIREDDFIPPRLGVRIAYHAFRKGDAPAPSRSVTAGGGISIHQLAADSTFPHSHDFAEAILILSGGILHHVNGEVSDMSPGTLAFIRPDDTHHFETRESDCDLVSFSFSLDILLALSAYLGNDFFLRSFTAPPVPPEFQLSLPEADQLGAEIMRVNSLARDDLNAAHAMAKALLARLVVGSFLGSARRSDAGGGAPEWLDRVCREMRRKRNYVEGLPALKRLAPRSFGHLCKSFRRHLGKTPTAFINELRAANAATLLADTSQEIFAIAADMGFESLSHFYHVFKKYYGIAPAKYREKMRRSGIPL